MGAVAINKNGDGKYRRRPMNKYIPRKIISARNNNSAFLPDGVDYNFYPKYRNDGTERPQPVFLGSKTFRGTGLRDPLPNGDTTPRKQKII